MKLVWQFLKPYKKMIVFVLLVMVLDVAGGLLIPTITAEIINYGIGEGNLQYIVNRGVFMLAVALLTSFGALTGSFLCANLAAKIARDIRNALYDKSLTFSSADVETIGTGSMITRTLSDVNVVQQTVTMLIQMVLPVPAVCVMGIVMAFLIDRTMGLILTAVTIAILLMAVFVTKYASSLFEKHQRFLDRVNVVIRENLTGVRVVRAFNKERNEEERMRESFENYAGVAIKANRLFAGLESIALLIMNVIIVVILFIGGNRIGAGFMKVGDITALTGYAVMILFYVVMAQLALVMIPRALVCVRRIGEILAFQPEITDKPKNDAPAEAVPDVVRFQNVDFRFTDADEDTLRALSFTCKRGQTTAIIGSTGSGKSTIAKLILRFMDVTGGAVLLNGVDIRNITQTELRNHISYVPQKAWLFSGTIADNLRHGNANATEEEMQHALAVAQASFVNELPDGIGSRVAQGGTNFSGGQKQRLSIARAMLKKSDLYIFDDSFSALDFKTDAALRNALSKEMQKSAVLIIAQRISTILNADQIIVLEDGKIAGIGTHRFLIENCSVYRDIAKSQMKGDDPCER